ncbi:hypothetical protein Cob_v000873 [Colletotrichum orbiculare MAFF 240422]|uniref:Secreted protein n=1 Tax=Colletotrichum orbiculare (strain 104-T / ATCC 96160 / CBS 514.97 / LARS 414 / MAFF 240422) TaxID=1213857 RepID=A0A484G771_COLOR|nr:hypothetical protein Cob_v000873 [Colletotrichum orbiculare MAFF 240422]
MPSFAPVYLFVLLAAHGARANFLTECEFLSFSRGEGERNPFIHYSCPTKQAPFLWCSRLELNDCLQTTTATSLRDKRAALEGVVERVITTSGKGSWPVGVTTGRGPSGSIASALWIRFGFRVRNWVASG